VNLKNNDGMTPLHFSSLGGHNDAVLLLMGNGAIPNAKTNHGSTPLMLACEKGHLLVVRSLLPRLDAKDVSMKDDDGDTALLVACSEGHEAVVAVLLDCGVDLDPMDLLSSSQRARDKGHDGCVAKIESYLSRITPAKQERQRLEDDKLSKRNDDEERKRREAEVIARRRREQEEEDRQRLKNAKLAKQKEERERREAEVIARRRREQEEEDRKRLEKAEKRKDDEDGDRKRLEQEEQTQQLPEGSSKLASVLLQLDADPVEFSVRYLKQCTHDFSTELIGQWCFWFCLSRYRFPSKRQLCR
jgi:hypothetical protein